MKLFKSDFSKVHAIIMSFALINVVMGISLVWPFLPYQVASFLHLMSGLLLIPLAFLLPAFFRNRHRLYAALKARFLITRRDIAQKNGLLIAAKTATMLLGAGFVLLFFSAILIKTGLGYKLWPTVNLLRIHVVFVYIIPVLMVIHPVLMVLAQRHPTGRSNRQVEK